MKYLSLLLLLFLYSCASYRKGQHLTTAEDYLDNLTYLEQNGYKILLNNSEIDLGRTYFDKGNIDKILFDKTRKEINLIHRAQEVSFISLDSLLQQHGIFLKDNNGTAFFITNNGQDIDFKNDTITLYKFAVSDIEHPIASPKPFNFGCRNYDYFLHIETNY